MSLSTEQLLNLAPVDLAIHRADRYDGGGFGVSIRRFAPEDVRIISSVYEALKGIYGIYLYATQSEQDPFDLRLYQKFLRRVSSPDFLVEVQKLGDETYGDDRGEAAMALRRVVHDLRGGGLAGLVGYVGLLEIKPDSADAMRSAVFLARDHAKMMRNALIDLDEPVRTADELERVHGIGGFVDKWQDTVIRSGVYERRIHVDCRFEGSISNRCLETSAIDRVVYNLINNACRFSAGDDVSLHILPASDDLVRWVVVNDITENHARWLNDNVGDNLSGLFEGGITRGGNGIGLSTCAGFVARSVGVDSETDCVRQGYIGAKLVDGRFVSWFHWPVHHPTPTDRRCDCRE